MCRWTCWTFFFFLTDRILTMSCSKITENTGEEPEDEEADDTLVVVVKPDGTIAIDQNTFNRVMGKQLLFGRRTT